MKRYISFLIIIIMSLIFMTSSFIVWADDNQISVATEIDPSSRRVKICGSVEGYGNEKITLVVRRPSGELDYIDQLDVLNNNTYEFTYVLEGREEGIYTVKANSINGSTTANFTYKKPTEKPIVDPDIPYDTKPYKDDVDTEDDVQDEDEDELAEGSDNSFDDGKGGRPIKGRIVVLPEKKEGKAIYTLEKDMVFEAFQQAGVFKIITIEMEQIDGLREYIVELPTEVILLSEINSQINIATPFSSVIVPFDLLKEELDRIGGSNEIQKISVVLVNHTEENDSTVIEIKILLNDEELKWDVKRKVRLYVPYELSEEELKFGDYIVAHYIDDKGNILPIINSNYSPYSKEVDFQISKPGRFMVTIVKKEFNDTNDYLWAKKEIELLAGKGIIKGISEKKYGPELNIIRGDFMLLLVRALELNATVDSNFIDIESADYYYEAIGIAKKLGITQGVGNNMFNPGEEILRQDMMVLICNALEAYGFNFRNSPSIPESFIDISQISPYAMKSIGTLLGNGIVKGSGNRINPLEKATRAESAVLIYRLLNYIYKWWC